MSGVAVLRYLLANNAPVIAVVPATRIISGNDAPIGTLKPLILVHEVDANKAFRPIKTTSTPKVRKERVQVSVLFDGPAASTPGTGYPGVKALLKLVRAACPNQRGTVNSVSVDSITEEGEGPDLSDAATGLYSQSNDFFVNWIET
jgi:hypothetical protein